MCENLKILYNYGWSGEERGNEILGRCPSRDHEDEHASFSINQETGEFNCLACEFKGKSGVTLIMGVEGLSKEEAIKKLNPIPREKTPDELEMEKIYKFNKAIQNHFHQVLVRPVEKPHALLDRIRLRCLAEISKNRKKNTDIMAKYGIGYSTNAAKKKMKELGFTDEDFKTSKLMNDRGNFYTSNRMTFPIIVKGNIIGWTMRTLDKPDKLTPKYIHAFNNKYFPQKGWLWGLDTKPNDIIITEGVWDAIAYKEVGFNAAAALGCNFSENRFKLLGNFKNIYLAFDNDPAGRKATENFYFNSRGLLDKSIIKVCKFHTKDPDQLVSQELRYTITRSVDVMKYIIDTHLDITNTPSELIYKFKSLRLKIRNMKEHEERKIFMDLLDFDFLSRGFSGNYWETILKIDPDFHKFLSQENKNKFRDLADKMKRIINCICK
jgi:DNA primase catalytic core